MSGSISFLSTALEPGTIIDADLFQNSSLSHRLYVGIARSDGIEAGRFHEHRYGFPDGRYVVACVAGAGEPFPLYKKRTAIGRLDNQISIYDGKGDSGVSVEDMLDRRPRTFWQFLGRAAPLLGSVEDNSNKFGFLALPLKNGKVVTDAEIVRFYLPSLVLRHLITCRIQRASRALYEINIPKLFQDWEQSALQARQARIEHIKEAANCVVRNGIRDGEGQFLAQKIDDHPNVIATRERARNRMSPLAASKNAR